MKNWGFLIVFLGFSACQSSKVFVDDDFPYLHEKGEQAPPSSEQVYRVYLIGDAGKAPETSRPVFERLTQVDKLSESPSAVVFLGDNIYPSGMPKKMDVSRKKSEEIIDHYLDQLEDFKGEIVFIPGNHDWESGLKGDQGAIVRLQNYLKSKNDKRIYFIPEDGLPGPHELKLTKDIRLIAMDSEWWLSPEGKPSDSDSWTEEASEFRADLEDLLAKNRKRNVIAVAHHPLRSNGRHSGRMNWKKHIFPLTEINSKLYIPLPVIGSLYPLYLRSVGGSEQDVAHPRYQEYIEMIREAFDGRDDIVYAAGHEHSLQYFRGGRTRHFTHEIVSGSGASASYVTGGNGAAFASSHKGFAVLNYYRDGSLWVEMYSEQDPEPIFQAKMKRESLEAISKVSEEEEKLEEVDTFPSFADSTINIAIRPDLDWGGPFSYFWIGEHYRKGWAQELPIKVLDLETEKAGLIPIKLGGSAQTNSLRVADKNGRQYVLRSIMKDATRSAVRQLSSEVVNRITLDQTSVLNPFAAFLIPKLADAAGVFHTNPELRYIPDDPRLGVYRDKMKNQVVLFEERPTGDMSHLDSMGNPRKVISSRDLWVKIDDDIDHRVDAKHFLRSRLFDHFIADWDRHDDQWRWGVFEPADSLGKIYKAIPRDRDFAFMKMDGLLPAFARVNFLPWYQNFNENYGGLKGLAKNSPHQMRRFTSELTRNDWKVIAAELVDGITDDSIDEALQEWPAEIQNHYENEFRRVLRARRDGIPKMAEEYYELMAKVMDVVGSNKTEYFTITRFNDSTHVKVDKYTSKGVFRKTAYSRVFHHRETKELRVYGLDGDDRFIVTGEPATKMTIRIIGGPGSDTYDINFGDDLHVYDSEAVNNFVNTSNASLKLSDDSSVNAYRHKEFRYDSTIPFLSLESNRTDGVFLGLSRVDKKDGFRKTPYSSRHSYAFNVAPKTWAFNLYYNGHYIEQAGEWGLALNLNYQSPTNILNFYGLGNETSNSARDARFYQANFTNAHVSSGFTRNHGGNLDLRILGHIDYYKVDEDSLLFEFVQPGISPNSFRNQVFTGAQIHIEMDARDQSFNPHSGLRWSNLAQMNLGVYHTDGHFAKLESELELYYSPSYSPQITFANRIGGSRRVGEFPFFDSSTLGSKSNLRGYRSTRFSGRSSVYNNLDLRASLFDIKNIAFQGELGYLLFYDIGRVWSDGGSSTRWHFGYGLGLWMNIMNSGILSATYGISSEDNSLGIKLGFFF